MGKEPKWNTSVKFTVFDETDIEVIAFDADFTEN